MISLTSLTKRYGTFTAVNAIDLEVPRGELFGFLGPNGAGKTTTLRMIAGILRPTGGTVEIGGVDLVARSDRARRSKLGFIPDRPFIYEKLTGAEFLRFVAGLYDQEGPQVEHRARELLALFDLEEWRDELVESYSHGMRQKLIISSAFVHRPEVIVVDEPMVGLDPKAARILKDLFREYTHRGHTIMMSTHTLEVAETMCDRIGDHSGRRDSRAAARWTSCARAPTRARRDSRRSSCGSPARTRRARWSTCSMPEALATRTRAARAPDPSPLHLLAPKWLTARARAASGRARTRGCAGSASACSALGVLGVHLRRALSRCCAYFRGVPEIGPLLAGQAARPHSRRLLLDSAAVEHHHGAVELLSRARSRPARRRRRSTGSSSTARSCSRRSCTRAGWSC